MRRGFTLLEIIVVIIIIGVLATLGFVQYSAVIEKARGAEAKATIGAMRTQIAALSFERAIGATVTAEDLGVGSGIPADCTAATNYFKYAVVGTCNTTSCTMEATRCIAGGKLPVGKVEGTVRLVWGVSGTDTWSSTKGY